MQYQKKYEKKEPANKNVSLQNSIDSGIKELLYSDPKYNELISPLSVKEQSSDNEIPHQSILKKTISKIKNELGGKLEMAKYITEKPTNSVVIYMPPYEKKGIKKSPKNFNVGTLNEKNEYNIRTINVKKSPYISKNQSDDFIEEQPISFKQKDIFLRSPNIPKKFKENDFDEILSNQVSIRNIEDFNFSSDTNKKINKGNNILKSNKVFKDNQSQIKQSFKNIQDSQSHNSIIDDDCQIKIKKSPEKSLTYKEVKKIMKRFTKVYNPSKNNHGALIGTSHITVPGASDDIFNNRSRVLNKMNRLSNILLSKRDKSPGYLEKKENIFRSKSKNNNRSLSRESLEKNFEKKNEIILNKPKNKFVYLSLAMISSKGPNTEDRVILRKMRMEKGGVVDLAQEKINKRKYNIKKMKKGSVSKQHYNPKYREKAAKIIQNWWKNLKEIYNERLNKIILIQSV